MEKARILFIQLYANRENLGLGELCSKLSALCYAIAILWSLLYYAHIMLNHVIVINLIFCRKAHV